MKVVRDHRQTLDKVTGADHEENIDAKNPDTLQTGSKQRESAGDQNPDEVFSTFPLPEIRHRKPRCASLRESAAKQQNVDQNHQAEAHDEQTRKKFEGR